MTGPKTRHLKLAFTWTAGLSRRGAARVGTRESPPQPPPTPPIPARIGTDVFDDETPLDRIEHDTARLSFLAPLDQFPPKQPALAALRRVDLPHTPAKPHAATRARRIGEPDRPLPFDRPLAAPVERAVDALEARETILNEQNRRRAAHRRELGRARERSKQREPRFIDARDCRNEPGERALERAEPDDRPALPHDPGRRRNRARGGGRNESRRREGHSGEPADVACPDPQLQRQQAVERQIRTLGEAFEPLGLMREMAEQLAARPASAQRSRDERAQAGPTRPPARQSRGDDGRADHVAQRLALGEAHVAGMARADDRGCIDGSSAGTGGERRSGHVRGGLAQRIGSRWIWRTSFSDPRR